MNRRGFLWSSALSLLSSGAEPSTAGGSLESYGAAMYRVVTTADNIDAVFVSRDARTGDLEVGLLNSDTTPQDDREVRVPCSHDDPGFHVEGNVPYETTLWPSIKQGCELMISLSSRARVMIIAHRDRAKEIVLTATTSRDGVWNA